MSAMFEQALRDLPVLTEVLQPGLAPAAGEALGAQFDAWVVEQLPRLVSQAMRELSPQIEQQLLDTLMPRLLASFAEHLQQQAPR